MENMRYIEKEVPAYFTLEATLVMPIVLTCICFLIFSGCFICDRCILQQKQMMGLIDASNVRDADENKAKEILLGKVETDFYFADFKIYSDIKFTSKKVKVQTRGELQTIFMDSIEEKIFSTMLDREVEWYNPLKRLRTKRLLEDHVGDK